MGCTNNALAFFCHFCMISPKEYGGGGPSPSVSTPATVPPYVVQRIASWLSLAKCKID